MDAEYRTKYVIMAKSRDGSALRVDIPVIIVDNEIEAKRIVVSLEEELEKFRRENMPPDGQYDGREVVFSLPWAQYFAYWEKCVFLSKEGLTDEYTFYFKPCNELVAA
jgi:hypothetical protein